MTIQKAIKTKEVRKVLRSVWSSLDHIWIFEKDLTLISFEFSKSFLSGIYTDDLKFKDELFDCDDFALILNGLVKLKVATTTDFSHSWAFGEAAMIHPKVGVHSQNIFITDDLKVWLFEPQSKEIFKSNQGESVFYVRM